MKDDLFADLLTSAQEMVAYEKGEKLPPASSVHCYPGVKENTDIAQLDTDSQSELNAGLPPQAISTNPVDPDNPPWTEEMLGSAVMQPGRGSQTKPTKVATVIQLDADVLAWFKAQGTGYENRINEATTKHHRKQQ